MTDKEIAAAIHAGISQFVEGVFGGSMGGSAVFDEHVTHVVDKARRLGYGKQAVSPEGGAVTKLVSAAIAPPPSLLQPAATAMAASMSGPAPMELSADAAGAIPDFLAPPPEVERPADFKPSPPATAPIAPVLGEIVDNKTPAKRRSK